MLNNYDIIDGVATYSGNFKSIILDPGVLWNKFRSFAACSTILVCSVFRSVHRSL